MTEAGRREIVAAKLHSAARKLIEVGNSGTLPLAGSLALEMGRKALAEQDFATAKLALESALRQCRSFWYRGAIVDAVTDIREASQIAAQALDG